MKDDPTFEITSLEPVDRFDLGLGLAELKHIDVSISKGPISLQLTKDYLGLVRKLPESFLNKGRRRERLLELERGVRDGKKQQVRQVLNTLINIRPACEDPFFEFGLLVGDSFDMFSLEAVSGVFHHTALWGKVCVCFTDSIVTDEDEECYGPDSLFARIREIDSYQADALRILLDQIALGRAGYNRFDESLGLIRSALDGFKLQSINLRLCIGLHRRKKSRKLNNLTPFQVEFMISPRFGDENLCVPMGVTTFHKFLVFCIANEQYGGISVKPTSPEEYEGPARTVVGEICLSDVFHRKQDINKVSYGKFDALKKLGIDLGFSGVGMVYRLHQGSVHIESRELKRFLLEAKDAGHEICLPKEFLPSG